VLLGAPGSGKGTQAKILAEGTRLAHLASGDVFRDVARNASELGRELRGYMERGELVPDSLTIEIIIHRLQQPDAARGAILDGFPRTVAQASALEDALCERGQQVDRCVYLHVPTGVLLDRLSGRMLCRDCQASFHRLYRLPKRAGRCDHCGGELYVRPDDSREVAERRLAVYFEHTLPLISHYRGCGLLTEVSGEGSITTVAEAMRGALGVRAAA
jgi:adenylate kinase